MSLQTCYSLSPAFVAVALAVGLSGTMEPVAEATLRISDIEPTVFFASDGPGPALVQTGRLKLQNDGPPVEGRVRVLMKDMPARVEELGPIGSGAVTKQIRIPDIVQPTLLAVEVLDSRTAERLAVREILWQPQRKWKLYRVFYSHGGVGFGNYPHRIRQDARHATLERALQNCRLTDGWSEDAKFRYVIESSETITSFINSYPVADVAELARRLRERQMELAALQNCDSTELLGHESLARLFYLSNRHLRDLWGVPASRTALLNDVVGVTWPMATFCHAANVPYLFHGHNSCAACMQPADAQPVFRWQAPGGNPSTVLVRSCTYGGDGGDRLNEVNEAEVERVTRQFASQGWPYETILLQNGGDYEFTSAEQLKKIAVWNQKWAYPRVVCATMEMFFDAISAAAGPQAIKTFTGDANNQWADEPYARLLGQARRLGETIPTAEKLSTIAATLTPGGYPWLDIYRAYHQLLLYHEHGGGSACGGKGIHRSAAQHYETELEEHHEIVRDAQRFSDRALDAATDRLTGSIATDAEQTLIVFNPMTRPRTDVVRFASAALNEPFRLVDAVTSREVPFQRMPDGELLFVAPDVPSMGYKAFRIMPSAAADTSTGGRSSAAEPPLMLENQFYRIRFDPRSGGISSILDKQFDMELVDQTAPHKLGEYLYEQFATPSFEEGSTWHRPESSRFQCVTGPVAQTMTAEVKAAGARRLTQRVTIYADVKRIDFAMFLDKAPSGRRLTDYATAMGKESVYVALPLKVPDFQIHHELPGAVIEPIRQQFIGSCTAFYAVRHFSDLANNRFGVTVSSIEAPLIEYGRPRSSPMKWRQEGEFESRLVYPSTSWVYLYLMNNMFDTSVRIDQRGPHEFRYSIRSHQGDWRRGEADQFGWDVHNPLLARLVSGKRPGRLPGDAHSFLSIDKPNVVCTTLKPAEANGAGFILRLVETLGVATTAAVAAPFCGPISSVCETSLVEDDLPVPLRLDAEGRIRVSLDPFGVKTLRILCHTNGPPPRVTDLQTKPVSDMEVALSWKLGTEPAGTVSQYKIYRGTTETFQPALANLVARAPAESWLDRPQLNFGGWIHNRLEPQTTYYYRVAAADRWNNEGPPSPAVVVTTLSSAVKNARPLPVEGLAAVHVSEVAPHNYINLIFRSNCESDIVRYEVHRSSRSDFSPNDSNQIGTVDPSAIVRAGKGYGESRSDQRMGDYDHLMYQDFAVQPNAAYYYRVCAMDRAGQKGPCSNEAEGRTGPTVTAAEAEANRVLAPNLGPEKAIDGDLASTGWASAPFGGGTKERPQTAWLSVVFPRKIAFSGLKLVYGPGSVPLPKGCHLDRFDDGAWKPISQRRDPKTSAATLRFTRVVEIEAIRLLFRPNDLPRSNDPKQDGIVRIAELLLQMPDGSERTVASLFPTTTALPETRPVERHQANK
ncbi:MAG: glycosyl hydrolase-related protein [Verrucomicrobia bacterium]|nr:glycosyl hydrolase-related protein [Verrucomicrobiota bacterium]